MIISTHCPDCGRDLSRRWHDALCRWFNHNVDTA